jgi:hypothetical protein
MSRIRTFMTVVLPSMLAGGLLFHSAFGNAATGDNVLAFWPAASDATSTRRLPPPPPPEPPEPPAPPRAPRPPLPPRPGQAGGGMSVRFDNGKVQIDGIKDLVTQQLEAARASLLGNKAIPKHVRDKVIARLDKARATVDKRLSNINLADLDTLEEEMEKMGEELEEAMSGFEEEMEKFGEQMGKDIAEKMEKDFAKNFGKNFGKMNWSWDHDVSDMGHGNHIDVGDDDDDDDDDALSASASIDISGDDDDLQDALKDLKDLALKPAQRDAINKLRTDSDRSVASARRQLDSLTDQLRGALDNPATSDAEVSRLIDQVSAQEAVIRKARIVAWVQARRVLDAGQQQKILNAAGKRGK